MTQSVFTHAFDKNYQPYLKHLPLNGLRLKAIEAYTRGAHRTGGGLSD